jgi:hypothetical protein
MVQPGSKTKWLLAFFLFACLVAPVQPQDTDVNPLDRTGEVMVNGHATPYIVRHLPVNAFPQLPLTVQNELLSRGCLIPQTYEAHHPENVVHASLERPGSSDWAVLCSVDGQVSLLVFFADRAEPMVLATASETDRLQTHGLSHVLGFNWGLDPASPADVHEAQLDMSNPPPHLDHDALADSVIDRQTIYRFYTKGAWTVVDAED